LGAPIGGIHGAVELAHLSALTTQFGFPVANRDESQRLFLAG
jgi:hypothetical protein